MSRASVAAYAVHLDRQARAADPMRAAIGDAMKLGHSPLCCASSLECHRCYRSGAAGPEGERVGAIFAEKCDRG